MSLENEIRDKSTAEEKKIQMREGLVVEVSPSTNFASVQYTDTDTNPQVWCPYGIAMTGMGSFLGWGLFMPVSIGSYVLTCRVGNNFEYIVCMFPPRPTGQGLDFLNWLEENKIKVNRLPVAESDKRHDNLEESRLKWGEALLRSSGLADILVDYIGNIVADSSKQFTIRIGDRDIDNKISAPELTVSFGRIVGTDGVSKKDEDGEAIKVEIAKGADSSLILNEKGTWRIKNSAFTIILKTDGTLLLGSDDSSEPFVLGKKMLQRFNMHTHMGNLGAPTSPPSGTGTQMQDSDLSEKIKGE